MDVGAGAVAEKRVEVPDVLLAEPAAAPHRANVLQVVVFVLDTREVTPQSVLGGGEDTTTT